MNVQEVARTRWRSWGAGLGDVRGVVEEAVRSHGAESERLVIDGPTGSVIWPIEAGERLGSKPVTRISAWRATRPSASAAMVPPPP